MVAVPQYQTNSPRSGRPRSTRRTNQKTQVRRGGVRRVRTTANPSGKKTIDERFRESYTDAETPLYNSLRNKKSKKSSREVFPNMDKLVGALENTLMEPEPEPVNSTADPTEEFAPDTSTSSTTKTTTRRIVKTETEKTGFVLRFKAIRIAQQLSYIGWFFYIFIQIPFAMLSLAFLGAAFAIGALRDTIKPEKNPEGVWETMVNGAKYVLDSAVSIAEGALKVASSALESVFGVDILAVLNPATWYGACAAVVFFLAIVYLLIIYFYNKNSGIEPLHGGGAGLKHGALLLCLIGYLLPLLNLFPWALLWIWSIAWRPK